MIGMRAAIWIVLAMTSTALLAGCGHMRLWNRQPTAPPLATGKGTIAKEQQKAREPAPPSTLPQPAAASETTPPELPPLQRPKVKRVIRSLPEHHKTEPDIAPPESAQAAPAPTDASPIGKLTTGDSSSGNQKAKQQDTLSLIQQTEEGLARLRLSTARQKATAAQSRVFLEQAKQALSAGDTDGANTLATKARLLLDELTGH